MNSDDGVTTDEEDRLEDPETYDLETPNSSTRKSSNSSIASPMTVQDQDEVMESSQDGASETHSEATELAAQTARADNQLANRDTLSEMLIENGFKLRQRISRDNVQASITVPMTAPTRSLVEVLSLIPREDAEQIGSYHGQIFMPQYFLEKFMLPTMQLKKILEEEGDQTPEEWSLAPGGPETAMMYSIFRQSQSQEYSAQSGKLRSLIAHSNEQTGDQVCQIREDMIQKTMTLESFVQQLRDVVQLPSARTIFAMTEEDIAEKNRLTDEVLQHFEHQLKLDYKAYERERQQNVLIAKLNYEQQLHIHDVNKECLNISNQRKEIVEKAMGLDVQLKVSQIKDTLKELQGNLAHQCQELTQVLSPLDTNTIMETLVKLRDALKDATYQNAYLVMQNNELYLHNSFMTPAQKAAIKKAQAEQAPIYRQQREDPHYIITVGKGKVATFKTSEEQVTPCSTYVSTDEILREVDEVIKNKGKRAAPVAPPITPASTGGKGKRTLVDLPIQGDPKYPRTESSDNSGKGEKPPDEPIGAQTFKSALLSQNQNKGASKGKGKSGKDKGKWPYNMGSRSYVNSDHQNIPSLNVDKSMIIWDIRDLEHPGTTECPLKSVAFRLPVPLRLMGHVIATSPKDSWFKDRIYEDVVTNEHRETYRHALECMRQAIQSPDTRLIQDQKTGGWINFECSFVAANEVNQYPNWYYYPDPSEKLGDFIRVLRKRPTRQGMTPELEYVPNDLYSFQMVKTMLKD